MTAGLVSPLEVRPCYHIGGLLWLQVLNAQPRQGQMVLLSPLELPGLREGLIRALRQGPEGTPVGDQSLGYLCILWATSLTASGLWAGGGGLKVCVPGLPTRGGVLAPEWTAQAWCHTGPASVQFLPGCQASGKWLLCLALSTWRVVRTCDVAAITVTIGGTAPWGREIDMRTTEVLPVCCSRWHMRSRGSSWEGEVYEPLPLGLTCTSAGSDEGGA